jgi:serine/threonine protein phosphatase PrpC
MKFSIYQESRQGPRKSNQDRVAYCYSRDALCMVIADGMGGHLHGEVAAQITTQFIAEAFQRSAQPRLADPTKFLLESITTRTTRSSITRTSGACSRPRARPASRASFRTASRTGRTWATRACT